MFPSWATLKDVYTEIYGDSITGVHQDTGFATPGETRSLPSPPINMEHEGGGGGNCGRFHASRWEGSSTRLTNISPLGGGECRSASPKLCVKIRVPGWQCVPLSELRETVWE